MEVFLKRWMLIFLLSLQVCTSFAFCQAFFAPEDNLTSLLMGFIEAEKKSIHGAMYMFTDKKVAQALVNAKNRGVTIQLIIDQISMTSYGKGKFLQEQGISIMVHRTQEFNPYTMALMHHKYFVFGCNKNNAPLVWTGSWNCTLRATQHNQENVLILDDASVVASYLNNFKISYEQLMSAE